MSDTQSTKSPAAEPKTPASVLGSSSSSQPEKKKDPSPTYDPSWILDPAADRRLFTYRDLVRLNRYLTYGPRVPNAGTVVPRKAFPTIKRKELCEMVEANPNMSRKALAKHFDTNVSTITRTLKQSDRWINSIQYSDVKAVRVGETMYGLIEKSLAVFFKKCALNDVLVTDDIIKTKALEFAKDYNLTSGQKCRPFTCSPKWLRKVKSRFGIVNGRFEDFSQSLSRKRDQALGSCGLLEFSSFKDMWLAQAAAAAHGAQPFRDFSLPSVAATSNASSGSLWPIVSESSTPADPTLDGIAVPWLIGAQGASPMPMLTHAHPNLPHHALSPKSSPEIYTTNTNMPELAATVGLDEIRDTPLAALDPHPEGAFPLNTDLSFLLPNEITDDPPLTVFDMSMSYLPPVVDDLIAPAACMPLDYSAAGMVSTDNAMLFSGPFPDPTLSPSSMWPTAAPPTFTQHADLSTLSRCHSSLFVTQPHVPQEDIDRLAAEMIHWPIENLLDDIGVPMLQDHADLPYGEMSSTAHMPSNWPGALNDFGNTNFMSGST